MVLIICVLPRSPVPLMPLLLMWETSLAPLPPLVVPTTPSVSDVYAASDCTGSAPNGVVQDPNPTFTFVSGDGTTQETCTYSETVSRSLAQVRILRKF